MKALLVDDEKNFLEQTKIFIEDYLENVSLDTVSNVDEALSKLENEEYYAIISDYQMPETNGLEFLKIIREEKNSDIPFIMFTGRGREDVAMKALNLGANRYIQKGGDPRSQYGVLADALIREIDAYKKEEKLKESERTYREIFEKVGIPIFIHDIDTGRVINANKEAAEMYGYSKEEIINMGVGSFSDSEEEYTQDKVMEQIEETIEHGPQNFLWKGEKKDGSKTWEEVKLTPAEIKGETRVLATINDITDLKKVEREKERNLKELQFINDTILNISRKDDIGDICNYLSNQVHSVNKDAYVFVSLYDEDKDAITLRSSAGLGEFEDMVSDVFDKIKDMSLDPQAIGDEKNLYTSGNLEKVSGGLYTLLAGSLDKESCKDLEEMLNIEKTYTVGFALEEEPYGGIIILKKDKECVKYKQAIETLASHLSVILQHKQEEEKRKKIEKRYKALYERSFDGVYILDLEGNFTDANPRVLNNLGYTKKELGSLTYLDIVPEESLPKINDAFNEVMETDAQEKPMEIKLKRKDGTKIWVETKTHLLYKDGEPHAFQGIARDIAERKNIEKKLRKKEKAIKTSLNGITMSNLEGEIHYVNDSLVEMWGYEDEEEILGRNTLEFFYDEEKTQEAINELLQKGRWKGELRGEKRDGSIINIFLSANLIYDEKGDPTDILASIIDISNSKTTKRKIEKLHDITQKLERCEEEDEVYDLAIEAAEKILDFELCTIDSVEGERFIVEATSSNLDSDGSEDSSLEKGIAGRTYKEGNSYLVSDIVEEDAADPVKNEYRSALSVPIGDFGVFQAVSTGKEQFDEQDVNMAELLMDHVVETLKRIKSSKKQEFLHSLLRHDVKNKTQVVEGYLHLLQDSNLTDPQAEFVEKALKATNEGQDILEKVKTLKEVKEEDTKNVNLKNPLTDAIESNRKLVENKNISIEWDENSCHVKGGPLLEELFFNIINNAVNHSGCSNIDISVSDEENNCCVFIEDDGVGIPDHDKDKVFDKGYRKGSKAGSGLGLHIAKTIVGNYGGNIKIKNSDMGGARFEISLKKVQ